MKISVVIPVYGCPSAIPQLCKRLICTLEQLTKEHEIILVNDGCPKGSWDEIQRVCAAAPQVIGIELSRNFGQIHAITAGLDLASGDWIVVMDCDLQDPPEGIIDLYNKALEGYDVVFARRKNRKDTKIKQLVSKAFYKIYDYFTDGQFDSTICNFSIAKREVIQTYCSMREQNRAYTLFLKWLGFRQTAIDIEAEERFEGKSAYTMRRKFRMASQFITAQSNKPLQLSITMGFVIALGSFAYLIYTIIAYFFFRHAPSGWTTLVVSLYFLGGVILIAIGVLGIYIGYIFNEVKKRPIYVVRTVLNDPNRKDKNK